MHKNGIPMTSKWYLIGSVYYTRRYLINPKNAFIGGKVD